MMLYIHIPFCQELCPYCSFNRYLLDDTQAHTYFAHLRREIGMVADLGYRVRSVYIGGGTPTILLDELLATLATLRQHFTLDEVSVETNPNHLPHLRPLEGHIDRLSVGVQSFDDDLLKRMKRYEKYGSGAAIRRGLQAVVGRFPTVNADFIFNLPGQTRPMLEKDIDWIKQTGVDQVTFYPLMVSPTVAEAISRAMGGVTYQQEAAFYRAICQGMMPDYRLASVWAFSQGAGEALDEYLVDHPEYIGVGAGSFSYLESVLYVNTFGLAPYRRALEAGHMSIERWQPLTRRQQMRYAFMTSLFGLRLDKRRFAAHFGVPLERALLPEMTFMRAAGAFSVDTPEELVLSAEGRYLLVIMMREFFIGANDLRDQAREGLTAPAGV
jgi:coproporphyrinogen III oxidase-like Fe-S oxidoreductase